VIKSEEKTKKQKKFSNSKGRILTFYEVLLLSPICEKQNLSLEIYIYSYK